jgi:hypothetical protein
MLFIILELYERNHSNLCRMENVGARVDGALGGTRGSQVEAAHLRWRFNLLLLIRNNLFRGAIQRSWFLLPVGAVPRSRNGNRARQVSARGHLLHKRKVKGLL